MLFTKRAAGQPWKLSSEYACRTPSNRYEAMLIPTEMLSNASGINQQYQVQKVRQEKGPAQVKMILTRTTYPVGVHTDIPTLCGGWVTSS